MLEYKPIASLTLDEARVLLEPEVAQALLGVDLGLLPGAGEMRLIDALASAVRPLEFWAEYLAGLHAALLDVNRASSATLARIPALLSTEADLLVKARPFFSLADLEREGGDLREVARRAGPYLAHEGYVFVDKPRGRMVELVPTPTGVIVRYREGAAPASVNAVLQTAALLEVTHDPEERLLACHWDVPSPERPAHLRALKESEVVETVAPFLEDFQGEVRLPYPDRLDLALNQSADQTDWERIMNRFGLSPIQLYATNYGSARVDGHPHDLGALYRTLRALASESAVSFTEPTYLVAGNP